MEPALIAGILARRIFRVERYPHFDVECVRTGAQRSGLPLLRDQLKFDAVTARLTAHSTFEFRQLRLLDLLLLRSQSER